MFIFKITFFVLVALYFSECVSGVYVYSSFWEPLFNPRILNYRVDSKFDPDSAKIARLQFERNYGYRGQNLIKDLGNGKGLPHSQTKDKESYGPVRFFYTFPGANENEVYNGI